MGQLFSCGLRPQILRAMCGKWRNKFIIPMIFYDQSIDTSFLMIHAKFQPNWPKRPKNVCPYIFIWAQGPILIVKWPNFNIWDGTKFITYFLQPQYIAKMLISCPKKTSKNAQNSLILVRFLQSVPHIFGNNSGYATINLFHKHFLGVT